MANLSPEFVRNQSRQNLSEMARLIDRLYERAETPEAREVLATMTKAISGIRPAGPVSPAVLDVERLLREVLQEYNANLDENKAEGIDAATVDIIRSIVSTRRMMCDCTVDADFKRGFKSYRKAHKDEGTKKELKTAYKDRYDAAMAEVDRYVKRAETLRQLVASYRLQTHELAEQRKLAEIDAAIQKLAAQYKKSTDQAERDRLNKEYQTLLGKKKSQNVVLSRIKEAKAQESKVETLLDQLRVNAELETMRTRSVAEIEELSARVTEVLKKAQRDEAKTEEAFGAADSAMDNYLRRAGENAGRGETLDDVILGEQSAHLDEIVNAGQNGAAEELPTLDDITNNE